MLDRSSAERPVMTEDALEQFSSLVAEKLRGVAVWHLEALERKHYVALTWTDLQDRLAALDESQRSLIRQCFNSCVDAGGEAFLQALQDAGASVAFPGGGTVALGDVD